MQFAKVDRSSVTEQIIEYLKDQILRQELKPGQQLPSEENLGSQLGVGRGTLREALRVLMYLGLIERHNKSTYVTSIATSGSLTTDFVKRFHKHRDVMQVIEVRKIIEPEAAAFAARRADAKQITEIGFYLAEMERHIGNIDDFATDDQAFHLALFRACGNHILLEFMQSIQEYLHQNHVLILHLSPGIEPHSMEFHRRLFKAISEGRDEEAREIMNEHILDIETEMYKIIKNESDGQPEETR